MIKDKMPLTGESRFQIIRSKIGGVSGYQVMEEQTGHLFSKRPLTYEDALSQLRALYSETARIRGVGKPRSPRSSRSQSTMYYSPRSHE